MNPNGLGSEQQPVAPPARLEPGSGESKPHSAGGPLAPSPGLERGGGPASQPLRLPGPDKAWLNHQPFSIPPYSSGDTSRCPLGTGELARPEQGPRQPLGPLQEAGCPRGHFSGSPMASTLPRPKKRRPKLLLEGRNSSLQESGHSPKRLKPEREPGSCPHPRLRPHYNALDKWELGPMGDHPLNRCSAQLSWPSPDGTATKRMPEPRSEGPEMRESLSEELKFCEEKETDDFTPSPLPKALQPSLARRDLPSRSHFSSKPAFPWTQLPRAEAFLLAPKVKALDSLGSPLTSVAGLLCTVARTSEEKYNLLNYRDKLLRQAQVKRTDLGQAKPLVGTCPDMCPEKERYMRESRKQLSIFEMLPGSDKVDHAAAIKEYSRSSADQEEPLAHELRPLEVLSMTMDYLLTHVMDSVEGNSREWYDFVWNRTRGVRKDITQQHLCDPLTVSLIEKCVRFHIHCAHQMCEEPLASFDAKINSENALKCLQSVKEMYQDLANMGTHCACEAELRSYDILLNVHQGYILRELQQLQPSVRNAPKITFAAQALSALNSNNFVRFFKLVQEAAYLEACILHSYFGQVRKDALKALSVAYTVSSQRSTFFPLYDLKRMLLFQDCTEAADFVTFYGLSVSDGWVELNRAAFRESERACKPTMSVLIKQKRTTSVGEVINGGPLPPITKHIPICSFDEQSMYVRESLYPEATPRDLKTPKELAAAPAQGRNTRSMGTLIPMVHPEMMPSLLPLCLQSAPAPQPWPRSELQLRPLMSPRSQGGLPMKPLHQPQPQPQPPHPLGISPHSSGAVQLVPSPFQVVQSVFPVQRNHSTYMERDIVDAFEEMVQDVILEECRGICRLEAASHWAAFRYIPEKTPTAYIVHFSEEICTNLLIVFLEEEIFYTAQEVLKEFQYFRKYLYQWKKMVLAHKKWKRQVRAFPPAPCYADRTNQLKALLPSVACAMSGENLSRGILNLGHAGRLGVSCTRLNWTRTEMIHQMKVQYFYQKLLSKAVWTPLDWPSLLSEHLPLQHGHVFWKVVLVLPRTEGAGLDEPGRTLADWVKAKFAGSEGVTCGQAQNKIQTLSLFSFFSREGDWRSRVYVSIKVVQGILDDEEFEVAKSQKVFFGTSGFILLLPCRERNVGEAESRLTYWLSAWRQLQRMLQSKPPSPLIPLLVLVPFQGEEIAEREVEEGLKLPDFIARGLISEYVVVEIPSSPSNLACNHQLSLAVKWLVSRAPSNPGLSCQTLAQLVEDGIQREFQQRFSHDCKERRLAGLPSQEPGAIVALYNSVLGFLAALISAEELSLLSWPAPEFARPGGSQLLPHLQWNTPEHLAWLKKTVLSFQIPPIALPPVDAPWNAARSQVFQYGSQIPSCGQAQHVLWSELESLLHRTYLNFAERTQGCPMQGCSMLDVPWDEVFSLCINHRLRDWPPLPLPVVSGAMSSDGQINVYFYKDHLNEFVCPTSWKQARLRTQMQNLERNYRI
ncbi:germinal-center associated nuclear protein-like isoform X2 [Notamacropus eugenii]|uniref:germinal-center associated nuclear protein-like isoform X2 n=1 Tax=Notamacropus eugenii TaxID=9315 RepID=UPI003B672341